MLQITKIVNFNNYRSFKQADDYYLRTWKTRAILPMARILLRITSLRAATEPPDLSIQQMMFQWTAKQSTEKYCSIKYLFL